MICKNCGETMEGEGYKSVVFCPNTETDTLEYAADEGPVYCNFNEKDNNE